MKIELAGALACLVIVFVPTTASALPCPGDGPSDVRVESNPDVAGGVRPFWDSDGPVVRVDPTAGGYKPALFARQLYRFSLMHGLGHICQGHITAEHAPRFEQDPSYTGWSGADAELAADCWAARQLASRGSTDIVEAAALMFDSGDGAFSGRVHNPNHERRAQRMRECADLR
jgi:hypothetical protein